MIKEREAISFWGKTLSDTYGWMMSDYEDLHGQILCFGGVAPLAGRGANNTQRVQQDTRGNVAAPQFSQLSWIWRQDVLRQNLKVYSIQSVTIRLGNTWPWFFFLLSSHKQSADSMIHNYGLWWIEPKHLILHDKKVFISDNTYADSDISPIYLWPANITDIFHWCWIIILYFVFVDDHTEFSQKAVGKTGTTQRGEQLSDCLLCPFPHTPAPRQQNRNCGMMIHPTEVREGTINSLTSELRTTGFK